MHWDQRRCRKFFVAVPGLDNVAGRAKATTGTRHEQEFFWGCPRVDKRPFVVQDDSSLRAVMRSGSPFTAAAAPTWERLERVFREPITLFQVFSYFAAFVAVFFRFIRPVIDLSEGVFGVANYVRDYFEGFRHRSDPLLGIPQSAFSEKSANSP